MASDASFVGDFSTGDFSQWRAVQEVSDDRITVVTSPARQGATNIARFEVRNGDALGGDSSNRAEIYQPHPDDANAIVEGEERYFGFALYLPADFPQEVGKWQLVQQWKQNGSGSPPLALEIDDHKFRLRRNLATAIDYFAAPVIRGRWVTFVVRVKFSSDATIGFVELWMDGVKQDLYNGAQRMYGATSVSGQTSYWKQGVYRDPTHTATSILYIASSRWGTSYADVAPIVEVTPVPLPRKVSRITHRRFRLA